jgi:hypothetical protein
MSDPHAPSTELDDFDRALLGSAQRDTPASGAAARAAVALGIAAVVAPAAAAAAATSVAGRAATLSMSKWAIIGTLGVAGAGTGTVAYLGVDRGPEAPAAAVAAPPARAGRDAARVPPPAAALPEAPVVQPPPVHDATPAAPGVVARPAAPRDVAAPLAAPTSPAPAGPQSAPVAAPTAPAAAAPAPAASAAALDAAAAARPAGTGPVSIAEEVALVDRARHALRQGRAGEAFDTLSLYQSRWPNGVLATEVLVLRVEAQLRLGQRTSAQRDARAFVAVHPQSRYATRLRELFAPGELD